MRPLLTLLAILVSLFCKAQLPKLENGKLALDKAVTFKAGSDELSEDGKEALLAVKEFLVQKGFITMLRVEGHIDNSISLSAGQALTEKRALAVCKWLVANGIDCKRLIAVGFGGTKPVASNDNPADKAQNSRIEFIPAALRGKNIGGMSPDGGGVVAGDPCN